MKSNLLIQDVVIDGQMGTVIKRLSSNASQYFVLTCKTINKRNYQWLIYTFCSVRCFICRTLLSFTTGVGIALDVIV